jgi:hypothetical protein
VPSPPSRLCSALGWKWLLLVVALAYLVNVPGLIAVFIYYADAEGLAGLGLAFAVMLEMAYACLYLTYFLLRLRWFCHVALRVPILSLPALLAAFIVIVVVGSMKLRAFDETLVTLALVTLPNLAFPLVTELWIRGKLRSSREFEGSCRA